MDDDDEDDTIEELLLVEMLLNVEEMEEVDVWLWLEL